MKKMIKSMKTILIADEDSTIREFVGLLFPDMDYRVVTTSRGADAILKAKEMKPDIVLADISLSDKDGYEVSREIKDAPYLKNTSVILITSSLGTFDEIKAAEARADDFVIKPFEPRRIVKKVEYLISQCEKREITSAFDSFPESEDVFKGGVAEFEIFDENTLEEKESEDYRSSKELENNDSIEEIKLREDVSESEEEIISLEEEVKENESDAQSVVRKIGTLEESKSQIVDKVSEIVIKRLSEVIPESISRVVDSVLKEEIRKIKED